MNCARRRVNCPKGRDVSADMNCSEGKQAQFEFTAKPIHGAKREFMHEVQVIKEKA